MNWLLTSEFVSMLTFVLVALYYLLLVNLGMAGCFYFYSLSLSFDVLLPLFFFFLATIS